MVKQKSEVRKTMEKLPVLGKKYSELKNFGEKKKFASNLKNGLEKQDKEKKIKEAVKVVINDINKRVERKKELEIKKSAKRDWKLEKRKEEEENTKDPAKIISKSINTVISEKEAKKFIKRKIPMILKDGSVFMYDTEKTKEQNLKDILDLYGEK